MAAGGGQLRTHQGVAEWCVRDKFSVYKGYCFLCSKSVACENIGKLQLIQHSQDKKHKGRMKLKYSSAQSYFRIAELEKRNKTVQQNLVLNMNKVKNMTSKMMHLNPKL